MQADDLCGNLTADLTVVFPVFPQQGNLLARIIACSARASLGPQVAIVAVTPHFAPQISRDTAHMFDDCGVLLRDIDTPLYFRHGMASLFKVDASAVDYGTNRVLMLSPGCLFMRRCAVADLELRPAQFSARATFRKTLFTGEAARGINHFAAHSLRLDMPPPLSDETVGFTCYNSGVLLYDRASCVADRWQRTVGAFLAGCAVPGLKGQVDQLALGALAAQNPDDFTPLPGQFNDLVGAADRADIVQSFSLPDLIRTDATRARLTDLSASALERGLNLLGEITINDLRTLTPG